MIQINIADRGIICWQPGEKLPALSQPEVRAVQSVYACGESLRWLLRRCALMPFVLKEGEDAVQEHCQWFGDHARFIVANLLCP